MPRHSDPKHTGWRKSDPRRGRADQHRHPIRTFEAPESVMEPFKREVARPGPDGKPFATGYGPAVVQLITDWLCARGVEVKKGVELVLHPAKAVAWV